MQYKAHIFICKGSALALLFAFVTLLVFSGADARAAQAEARRTIVIGGDLHYPPYEFLDANGEPNGFNVELSNALGEVTGLNIEIRLGLWKNMRRALEKGEIDLLQGISHSPTRAEQFSFSKPYTTVEYSIFARENSPMAAGLADMDGKTVIVEQGGTMFDKLHNTYPNIIVSPAYNHENALRRLAAGHGDFALVSKTAGLFMIQSNSLKDIEPVGTPISLEHYCYAATKKNQALIDTVNAGLETLKADGTYERLCRKWLVVNPHGAFSWQDMLWYGALIVVPLLFILCGSLLWSKTLQRQVTQRTKALQEEARQHLEAKKELERKQKLIIHSDRMATLGVMASGIAHEINNPNGMILMNLPILADTYQDELEILDEYYEKHGDFLLGGLRYSRMRDEISQMLADMLEGSKRIKNIVHDLKDFARKGEREDMDSLDMNMLVESAIRLVRSQIRKSTNHFTMSLGVELPPVLGSSHRIQQVIVNLVINACQALPDKEKALLVSTSYDKILGAVILEVSDEGTGIPQEFIDNITDPFFTTKRESGGTGLGLAVSAGIIKEHCGSMDFESTPGLGTRVTVSIPAITDDAAYVPRPNRLPAPSQEEKDT